MEKGREEGEEERRVEEGCRQMKRKGESVLRDEEEGKREKGKTKKEVNEGGGRKEMEA